MYIYMHNFPASAVSFNNLRTQSQEKYRALVLRSETEQNQVRSLKATDESRKLLYDWTSVKFHYIFRIVAPSARNDGMVLTFPLKSSLEKESFLFRWLAELIPLGALFKVNTKTTLSARFLTDFLL